MKHLVITLILASLVASCDFISSLVPPPQPQTVMVVMCDITRSLDTNSISKIKQSAVKILKDNPDAEIHFLPIDSNLYVNSLMHKKSYAGMKYAERTAAKEGDSKHLLENIQNAYERRNARASCVLKGFNISHSKFQQYQPKEKYNFKLVFLSDLLECCYYSYGRINIENSETYAESLKALKDAPKPEFNLASLGVKITFVITAHRQLPIDEGLHRDFWRVACKRFGYTDEQFNNFTFDSEVPQNL